MASFADQPLLLDSDPHGLESNRSVIFHCFPLLLFGPFVFFPSFCMCFLGPSWGPRGALVGPSWGPPGALLRLSCGPPGASWALLGPSWGPSGFFPRGLHVWLGLSLSFCSAFFLSGWLLGWLAAWLGLLLFPFVPLCLWMVVWLVAWPSLFLSSSPCLPHADRQIDRESGTRTERQRQR